MKKKSPNIIKNIRELIAEDKLNQAITLLKNLLENSPELDEVILQAARLQSIRKQVRTGQVNFEDGTVTHNQIRAGLIELVGEIAIQEKKNEVIQKEIAEVNIQHSKNILQNNKVKVGGDFTVGDTTNIYHNYGAEKIPKYLGTPFIPDVFIGRETDLEEIHQKLFKGDNLLLLVNGEGGIGKTTLAAKYYQTYQDDYIHLAWVFAEKSLLEALLTLAIPLNIKFGDREPNASRFNRVLDKMRQLTKPCLLVIDNANQLADLENHYIALKSCPNFHLLLTTRITEFEQAETHRIEPLTDEKAKELFKKHYKKHQDNEDEILLAIFEAIGKNTLVIELLAKNLNLFNRIKKKYSLANLLVDLQEKGMLALESKMVNVAYQGRGKLRKETPEAIIAAMYDLGELLAEEKRLMSVFAVLPAENVEFEILETLLLDTANLDDTLLSLSQKGWLDFNEEIGAFKVSPVIQEVTKNKNGNILSDCEELILSLIHI